MMEGNLIHKLIGLYVARTVPWACLAGVLVVAAQAHANALIGTYAQNSVMVADGSTVYTAWVFVDNTGLAGEPTWGSQHMFFLPPYATLVPGGLGVAYDKPDPGRDFYSGNPMVFEVISGPTETTGRLVNQDDLVVDSVGDIEYYKFTINPDAPHGIGNFDLGPGSVLTGADGSLQPSTKHNVLFTITGVAGDLNLDGFVGIEDLNMVLGNWNTDTGIFDPPVGDSNGDGFVGIEDLNWVLSNWNAGVPPVAVVAPEPSSLTLLLIGPAAMLRRAK